MTINSPGNRGRTAESFFRRNRTFRGCARKCAAIAFAALAFGSFGTEGIRFPAAHAQQSSIGKSLSSSRDEDRLKALQQLASIARKTPDSSQAWLHNPRLIKMLKDTNYEVRRDSAYVLGLATERKAVPTLIQGLGDDHPRVRESFGNALGEIGVTDAQFSRITSVFQKAKTWQEQGGAALALGSIGDLKSLPQLWEAYEALRSKRRMLPRTELMRKRLDTAEDDVSHAISMYMSMPVLEKALLNKTPSIRMGGALTLKRMFRISVGITRDDLIRANDALHKARLLETDAQVKMALDEAHSYILKKYLAPRIRIR